MRTKVMAGQEKTANGLERGVISLITFQNGKKLDFSGLVVGPLYGEKITNLSGALNSSSAIFKFSGLCMDWKSILDY